MAKTIKRIAKIQLPAGGAKPGAQLASIGIQMPQFCKAFNDATQSKAGQIIPVIITAYEDKSFDFVLKTPPTVDLIKKELKLEKGSAKPQETKVAKISQEQIKKVAQIKLEDLNTSSLEAAMKIVEGTCKSLGIEIEQPVDYKAQDFHKNYIKN